MINNTYTYLLICLAVLLTSCNDDVAKPNPIITPNTTDECAVYTWQYLNNDLTLGTNFIRYGMIDSIYIDKDSFYVIASISTVVKIVRVDFMDSNETTWEQYPPAKKTCDYEVDTVYVNYGENRINDFLYKENIPIDTAKLISFFDTISLAPCSSSPALEFTGYRIESRGLPTGIEIRSLLCPECGDQTEMLSLDTLTNTCKMYRIATVCDGVPITLDYPPAVMKSDNRIHVWDLSETPTGIVNWELILVNRYGEEFVLNMESVFVIK